MFLGVITTSIISLASVQSSVLPSANVSVDLDWSTFLARHDMLWSWTWGAHGVSTIRTRSTDLEHCGPGGSPGACCIEAPVAMDAANVRAAAAPRTRTRTPTHRAPFTGFVQLALVSPTQRGCSPSAVPPGECCMPVVWSNSDKMSGCHAVDDTRWDFNQFFTVRLPPAPHAANGSATRTDTTFQLRSRGSKQLCLTLAATSPQSTKGNNHSRSAASGLAGALCDDSFSQHEQLWQLRGDALGMREGGPAQIESVAAIHTGRAMCLHAIDGREAGGFTIATCSNTTELSLSDNTLQHQLWSPLCSNGSAGAEPVPGWPCVTRDVPTPAPPPTPTPASPIKLAACNASSPTQQWLALSNGSLISVSRGLCLTYSSAPSPTFLAQCRDGDDTQMWNVDDGFLTAGKSKVPTVTASGVNSSHSLRSDAPQLCLQAATGQPFCNGTICPAALAQLFVTDTPLAIAECHNGDRSMLFATQVIRDDLDANAEQSIVSSEENLVPLTWATSAYVGNGALGVRIAAEAGEGGVLRFFCDNVLLGAGSHRQATGYFRLITSAGATAAGKPPARAVHVSMRQHLKDARLTVNISDSTTGSNLIELDLFVNANYTTSAAASGAPEGQGAAVLQVRWRDGALPAAPALEWVAAPKSQPKMWWLNTTSRAPTGEHILTAYISVVSSCVADAVAVVNAARNAGRDALLRASSAWWATYWDQAFVALPFTRMEGLYYAEMYRFAASDRITLHGLMGAIGPTGIFNLWPDDVWDMNEQVMYWISAASNRPQISEPMCEYVETNGVTAGGLWMIHQYVKQARFDGRDDRLRDHAWSIIVGAVKQQAGGARTSPGTLKKLSGTADDGRYHIVGCSSPEYRCYPPFETLACTTTRDCNFGLAQLRWGLATALELTQRFALDANLTAAGVDVAWWRALAGNGSEASGELAWYPYDVDTGFRLDASCSFDCPHRHFSHLLQLYDLESVRYDSAINPGNSTCSAVNETLNALVHRSIDRWYRLTCDPANWFNEECRGFTHCGFAAMSAVSGRPDAAAGNLSELLDTLITPNAMYGEMVYQSNPGEFAPVSESAYCAAGVLHEMLLHTHKDSNDGGDNGVLQIFPGIPDADPRWANASFHEIRASGALLVSASREEGSLQWVAVLSERGGTVRLSVPRDVAWNVPSNSPAVEPVGATRVSSTESSIYGRTVWTFVLGQGQRVVLYVGAAPAPGFIVTPQRTNASELNFFGFRRQMKPLH